MAEKVRDYEKLARDIIVAVGGEQNVLTAAHCATRLRMELKETPKDANQNISRMPGVITVVEKGGQFQVVIGPHVTDVYEILAKEIHIDENQESTGKNKNSVVNKMIAVMSAVFAPFIYMLAAAGLLQGILILAVKLAPGFGATGTYEVLNYMSWVPFVFMPVLIAITASKHFHCNTIIAVACCAALISPDWGAIAARVVAGEDIRFLFFKLSETGELLL